MTREYNGGKWTQGRFNSFVKAILRSGSRRWPPKYETLNAAFVGKKVNSSSGRLANHYQCAACTGFFTANKIQVDHIVPIINPKIGFTTWDEVINNLFCEKENMQALCLDCHKAKTADERKLKKEVNDAHI